MVKPGLEPGNFTVRPVLLFGIDPLTGEPVPIHTLDNALNGHDADVHTRPLNIPAIRKSGLKTNPVGAVPANSWSITVADSTDFPPGVKVCIKEGNLRESVLFKVITRTGGLLTFDMRFGLSYTSAAELEVCYDDLAGAAGSMASPLIYSVGPPPGKTWHLYRFLPKLTHASAADDSKFGDLAALTNGYVFRKRFSDGSFGNFTNWKTNNDLIEDMYNVDYTDKAGGGNHGTKGRASIKEGSGAIIKLVGSVDDGVTPGEEAEIVCQDSTVTGLVSFLTKFQGHEEGS